MSWNQLLSPNPGQQDWAGSCLSFSSHAFNVPDRYGCAWDAWSNSVQHADWEFPSGVAHPVWFEHWGTYGEPPTYKNWGHVCVRFSDGRLMSSPGSGYGQQWFNSIQEVESWFNCRYVGWSEDINGVRVIQYKGETSGDDDMYGVAKFDDGWAGFWNMTTGQIGHIDTVDEWNRIAGSGNVKVWSFANNEVFTAWKNKYANVLPLNVDADAIAKAVVVELGNTQINVDALATAIADKIGNTCNCGCGIPVPSDVTTKVEILSAIEANYPEDK